MSKIMLYTLIFSYCAALIAGEQTGDTSWLKVHLPPAKFELKVDQNTLESTHEIIKSFSHGIDTLAKQPIQIGVHPETFSNGKDLLNHTNTVIKSSLQQIDALTNKKLNVGVTVENAKTISQIIKSSMVSFVGAASCVTGLTMMYKGINNMCRHSAAQKLGTTPQPQDKDNRGWLKRFLLNPYTLNTAQTIAGVGAFGGGLIMICKSDGIVNYFNNK